MTINTFQAFSNSLTFRQNLRKEIYLVTVVCEAHYLYACYTNSANGAFLLSFKINTLLMLFLIAFAYVLKVMEFLYLVKVNKLLSIARGNISYMFTLLKTFRRCLFKLPIFV